MYSAPQESFLEQSQVEVPMRANGPEAIELPGGVEDHQVQSPREFIRRKYDVVRKLGSGGVGSVYLCIHKHLRAYQAVKVLQGDSDDQRIRQFFLREAHFGFKASHQNIVNIFDVDEDENGYIYLAMEYIDGESVGEMLENGPLDFLSAMKFFVQALEGLEYLRESGVFHGDISPDNIMVNEEGVLKIIDLGAAHYSKVTGPISTVMGKYEYLPPELGLGPWGEGPTRGSHRSDLYSLALVVYRLLTKKPPFEASTAPELLRAHAYDDPTPLHDVCEGSVAPRSFQEVLDKMLEKNPASRGDAGQFVKIISSAIERYEETGEWLFQLWEDDGSAVYDKGLFEASVAVKELIECQKWDDARALIENLKFNNGPSPEISDLERDLLDKERIQRGASSDRASRSAVLAAKLGYPEVASDIVSRALDRDPLNQGLHSLLETQSLAFAAHSKGDRRTKAFDLFEGGWVYLLVGLISIAISLTEALSLLL